MIVKQFFPNIIIILRTFYRRLYGGIVVKNVRTRMYHFSDSHFGQQFCAPISTAYFGCDLTETRINFLSRKDNSL